MEAISIFDIFKIGVGPSSSHTLGPWKAALDFRSIPTNQDIDKIEITLFGSLSKTGKGHATDKAIQLGLLGYLPETIATENIDEILKGLAQSQSIKIGNCQIKFDPKSDILFSHIERSEHPNTLEFKTFLKGGMVFKETYLSIGGGFIEKLGEPIPQTNTPLPYPIDTAKDLLNHLKATGLSIPEIVLRNEQSIRPLVDIEEKIWKIFSTIKECLIKGCLKDGILPGGLGVKRRAKDLCQELLGDAPFSNFEELKLEILKHPKEFSAVNKWVSCFALAINEENAAMGRVVTSPTNGAAGVIPAVLFYYYFFCNGTKKKDIINFFLTSGEIGSLFKKGATISAAVGGCQAEIGVSSAMAAGGLTEVLGGTPNQVLMAAEIAMEHHLGMTCDPIGGLVQIPCIERNAMGAIKAITAANLALSSNPFHSKVDLDTVIQSMWDTAQGMHKRFKETSEGGLAFYISVVTPEC